MSRPSTAPGSPQPLRLRIIEAASALFRQSGYDVSMEAIAQAADVSKQSLYNHFGSKEELFKSIIAQRSEALRAPLLAAADGRAPRDVLVDFAREYHGLVLSARGTGFMRMVISASQRFPDIGTDFYEAGPGQTLAILAEWMARQHRAGRLHAPDPQLAAEHFLSLLHGYVMIRGLLGFADASGGIDVEARAQFCADMVLHALAHPASAGRDPA